MQLLLRHITIYIILLVTKKATRYGLVTCGQPGFLITKHDRNMTKNVKKVGFDPQGPVLGWPLENEKKLVLSRYRFRFEPHALPSNYHAYNVFRAIAAHEGVLVLYLADVTDKEKKWVKITEDGYYPIKCRVTFYNLWHRWGFRPMLQDGRLMVRDLDRYNSKFVVPLHRIEKILLPNGQVLDVSSSRGIEWPNPLIEKQVLAKEAQAFLPAGSWFSPDPFAPAAT